MVKNGVRTMDREAVTPVNAMKAYGGVGHNSTSLRDNEGDEWSLSMLGYLIR
jgi:hypothetical protein